MKSMNYGRSLFVILLDPSRIVGTGSSKEEVDLSFERGFHTLPSRSQLKRVSVSIEGKKEVVQSLTRSHHSFL